MKWSTILIIIVALVTGFLVGTYINPVGRIGKNLTDDCESKYGNINSRLGCLSQPVIRKHEYAAMAHELNSYIEEEKKGNKVQHVSIYFRDLLFGPTLGIEENARFAPASLLKVPLLIRYLNLAEKDPNLLAKKIVFTNATEILDQTSSSSSVLKENSQYTIEELLSYMVVQSDNTAYSVLFGAQKKLYPENSFQDTLLDLGLINPRTPTEDTITVKAYSSLFRHLYNSSYLSPEMSERALELLIKTEFKKGLVAGVPTDIKVAHKFGEREGLTNGQKQLHDCGIIYFPGNPYLLCVMTRGDDYDDLSNVIKTVSEKVYQEVDSRKY